MGMKKRVEARAIATVLSEGALSSGQKLDQPGMKPGSLKNQRMIMVKRTTVT